MAYRDIVLNDSPTMYLRFEETSGSTLGNETANVFTITTFNTPTLGVAGALADGTSKAIQFTPLSQKAYVRVNDNALLDGGGQIFTLEFWLKRNAHSGVSEIVWSKGNGEFQANITATGAIASSKPGSGTQCTSTIIITDTNWHYIVIVSGPATTDLKIYIDNVDRSGTVTGRAYTNTTANLFIGVQNDITNSTGATIDELVWYQGSTLNVNRIATHYNAGLVVIYSQAIHILNSPHQLSQSMIKSLSRTISKVSSHSFSYIKSINKNLILNNVQNFKTIKSIGKILGLLSTHIVDVTKFINNLLSISLSSDSDFSFIKRITRTLNPISSSSFLIQKLMNYNRTLSSSSTSLLKTIKSIGFNINIFSTNLLTLQKTTALIIQKLISVSNVSSFSVRKHISTTLRFNNTSNFSYSRVFSKFVNVSSTHISLIRLGDDYIIDINISSPNEMFVKGLNTFKKAINVVSNYRIIDPIVMKDLMIKLINKIGV